MWNMPYNETRYYELNFEPSSNVRDWALDVRGLMDRRDYVGERRVSAKTVDKRRAKNKAARRARRKNG